MSDPVEDRIERTVASCEAAKCPISAHEWRLALAYYHSVLAAKEKAEAEYDKMCLREQELLAELAEARVRASHLAIESKGWLQRCDLVEAENARLKEELAETKKALQSWIEICNRAQAENARLTEELRRLDEWVQIESHGAFLSANNPVNGAIEIAEGRGRQAQKAEADRDEWERLCQCNIDHVQELIEELAEVKRVLKWYGDRVDTISRKDTGFARVSAAYQALKEDGGKRAREFLKGPVTERRSR